MPLIKGTTTIGDIYKGTTKIDSIYKGTTLVYSSGTWEQWYQEFLYNALIPTTINSKQVKNKARVDTVYGNSVVENQLVPNGNFESTSGWDTINGTKSVSDNILTQTLTAIGAHKYGNGLNKQNFEPPLNHKYLCIGYVKPKYNGTCYIGCGYTENISSDISITANQWNKVSAIITNTRNSGPENRFTLAVNCTSNYQVGDTIEYKELECIDLTQRFPFNTPTTLDDTRIQAILNGGYIPYNTGEIKSVDMSSVSTTKSDTTALETITFKYQGSGVGTAHDTMEITNTEYVFTKNIGIVDLSTLSWTYQSANGRFYTNGLQSIIKLTSTNNDIPNILSNNYIIDAYANVSSNSKKIYETTGGLLFYYTYDSSDTPTGTLYYELATPQVISIPKKYLGIVDLGSLDWAGANGNFSYYMQDLNFPNRGLNEVAMYCERYINGTSGVNGSIRNNVQNIAVYDTRYTDATAFKNSLQGQYLFYETENEVADIITQIGVEIGGTITTNSNVLPNIYFEVKCK